MKWFKKLLQQRDASPRESSSKVMKWFNRSTVEQEVEQEEEAPLRSEIDVVPKTEFSASRQTLNNINIVLKAGESSEVRRKYQGKLDNKTGCSNKCCCGNPAVDSKPAELADNGDDESIKNYNNSKSTLIDNLWETDNNARASEGSTVNVNETECRRPSKVTKHVNNNVCFYHTVDNGRVDCPDSMYPSMPDPCGKYVELKSKRQRQYCENCDLFTTSDKPKSVDKSPLNYSLLSNVEKELDESKYNLRNCKSYNEEYRAIHTRLRLDKDIDWKAEDFNDDNMSTRMSEGTQTVKEFYRLSNDSHLLLHFHNIKVETGRVDELHQKKFSNFLAWFALKGKEITEEHKISETSWITRVLNLFKMKSKSISSRRES